MSYSLAFSQAIAISIHIAIKVEEQIYDFVPTHEIASFLGLAKPSVVKVLQQLTKAGLFESREGAKGGVRLAKSAQDITLLDIFHAIEQDNPLFRIDLQMRVENAQVVHLRQQVSDVFQRAQEAMKAELQAVTLADIYR